MVALSGCNFGYVVFRSRHVWGGLRLHTILSKSDYGTRRRVRLQLCSAPCFVKIYRWLRSPWATQTTQFWQVKADGTVQGQDYSTSWGVSKKFSVAFGSSTMCVFMVALSASKLWSFRLYGR